MFHEELFDYIWWPKNSEKLQFWSIFVHFNSKNPKWRPYVNIGQYTKVQTSWKSFTNMYRVVWWYYFCPIILLHFLFSLIIRVYRIGGNWGRQLQFGSIISKEFEITYFWLEKWIPHTKIWYYADFH